MYGNYIHKKLCTIVAHWILSYILTLFKPYVSNKTLDKVIVYDGNKSKYLSHLKTHIPAEILPVTLANLK